MQTFDLPDASFQPQSLGFSPDGRLLAVWCNGSVFVADLLAGAVRTIAQAPPLAPYLAGVVGNPDIGFTADGKGVVALHLTTPLRGSPSVELCVFDAGTGGTQRFFPIKLGAAFEIGPGARWVYAATHANGRVGVTRWNPLTGRKLPAFGRFTGHIQRLAVSADEGRVIGSWWDQVRVWNMTGDKPPERASKQLQGKKGAGITALALSADGNWAAASAGAVSVWDVNDGARRVVSTALAEGGRGVAFHPARSVLVFGSGGEAVFFDPAAQTELKRYAWNVGPLTAFAFSHDGLRCAATGTGKMVVWDVDV